MSTPAAPAAPVAAPAPESGAPGLEPTAPVGGAPDPHGSPVEVQEDGRAVRKAAAATAEAPSGTVEIAPETPAASVEPIPDPAIEPTKVADLPEWAQKIISETREEAAKTRIEAKNAAEAAAEAARKQFTQQIGSALGIIPPEGAEEADVPPTPEELLTRLTAEQESTRSAKIELAIYKAAGGALADPLALLDSRAFLDSVKEIDPTDLTALAAAITSAVEANPRLKLVESVQEATPEPTPPPSGGAFAGGPSGRGNDVNTMSIDDFRKQYKDSRASRR